MPEVAISPVANDNDLPSFAALAPRHSADTALRASLYSKGNGEPNLAMSYAMRILVTGNLTPE
jgi:hypothetical protein